VRKDKRNHQDELANAAEKAAADNQQGALYSITNTIYKEDLELTH